jgi:DNA-binding response OmpR family regulator
MDKKRIMIIEDDLELLSILHDLFVNEGFNVIVYPDKNSIKGVIINRPDMVLLDDRLGDGFGHELCAKMKANDLTNRIPVILTSGYSDLRTLKEQCGADDYINKPFDLDSLVAMVHRHLQAKDADKLILQRK